MFGKNALLSRSCVDHRFKLEFLESRRLLAGDFQPGDSNEDYYFDEADLVQVMKFGKYDTGESADWVEGDWNEDGQYNARDIVPAFSRGLYRQGSYDDVAELPINNLAPISDTGEADTTIVYIPENGDVITFAPLGMTALHLVSRSSSFGGDRGTGLFDVATDESQFIFKPDSHSWIEHPRLLPIGWSTQQVLDDLLVDGAISGGGGLGNVRLGVPEDLPAESPDDALVTRSRSMFVAREEANGILTYDPQTGDILIEAIGDPIYFVELFSAEGLFTGTVGAEERYTVHNIDEASVNRFTRIALELVGEPVPGRQPELRELPLFTTIYLPGFAQTALTHEDFVAGVRARGNVIPAEHLVEGVKPSRADVPTDYLEFALEIAPVFARCEVHLTDGAKIGDANLDGLFNSSDLVSIFQAGEYEDDISGNSKWSEGDWNCDGDFGTSDLVTAFQAGNYELPAAMALLRSDDDEYVPPLGQPSKVVRALNEIASESEAMRRIVLASPTISNDLGISRLSANVSRNLATDEIMVEFGSL